MSSDDNEMSHVGAEVPTALKERVREHTGYGGISEVIRTAMHEAARNGVEYHREQIRTKEEEIAKHEAEIARIESEIADHEAQIEAQHQEQEERERYREEVLEELESAVRDGDLLFPEHSGVVEAAEVRDTTPEAIIEELMERNPKIPETAFRPAYKTKYRWTGENDDGSLPFTRGSVYDVVNDKRTRP